MQIAERESSYIYDSEKRDSRAKEEFVEAWRYRDLIFQLTRRDVTARYKRSVLGIAWTMLNPLGMMLILSIVFSQVFPSVHGYPTYVLSGLIVWNFFSQATSAAINSLVWGGDLFRRIYVPRSVFAISAIATGLVNLAFAFFPLLVVMLATGIRITPAILLTPITVLPLAAFALAVGLLISTIGIYFADIVEMYNVILMAWFYATPIVYPLSQLPKSVRSILSLNPMLYLVELFRIPLYQGHIPSIFIWSISFLIALTAISISWIIFSEKSDEFVYRT